MKNVEVYLLAPDKNVLSQNIVIKTPNDKIIVIDGGHQEFEPCLAPAIRAILNKGQDEYFEIEAWFISHAHNDHYGEAIKLLNGLTDKTIKVNNFYFDFPELDKCNFNTSDYSLDNLELFKKGLDNYKKIWGIECEERYYDYLNGKVVNGEAVKNGLTLTIDGVNLDIIQTRDDSVDEQVNANSMVIRMRVKTETGEKKVLFLNDVSERSGLRLLKNHGEALKSEVVQLSHHGQAGASKEVYDVIDAKIRLWPVPFWVWTNPERFRIGEVRGWFGVSENGGENDLIACLYKNYPDDRTKASDWKKCKDQMKIIIDGNI